MNHKPSYFIVIAAAILIFLIVQTIQALSVAILLEILSKVFRLERRTNQELKHPLLNGFWILSIALFFLLINSLLQIGVWAEGFVVVGEFVSYADAFYHSAVNFATLGYGDIVMSPPWRLLGALEAMSGVLMLGLSTAMLSNVFSKLLQFQKQRSLSNLRER